MGETETLPVAEELNETPTDLRTLVLSLLAKPSTATACALLDLLDDMGRSDDARGLLKTLRDSCALSNNGKSPHLYWHNAQVVIRQLFWFDIHGFAESLDQTFSAIEKEAQKPKPSMTGGTMTSSISVPGMITISGMSAMHSSSPYLAPSNVTVPIHSNQQYDNKQDDDE